MDVFKKIIIPLVSSGSLAGFLYIIHKLGKYSQEFTHIKANVEKLDGLTKSINNDVTTLKTLDGRIIRLESNWDERMQKMMTQRKSPLSLTPYAEKVLKDIKFDIIFEKIKETLVSELEEYKLRTAYDVQEMAKLVVRKKRDDVLFDEIKQEVYKTGNNLDEVIAAIYIPLRDYYLTKHPETLNTDP